MLFTGGVVLDIVFVIFRGDQSVYIHEGAESSLNSSVYVTPPLTWCPVINMVESTKTS